MIHSVVFHNFMVLRDTALPLGPFTLIVGPNGSGKSTAFHALKLVGYPQQSTFSKILTAGLSQGDSVKVIVNWGGPYKGARTTASWYRDKRGNEQVGVSNATESGAQPPQEMLTKIRIYSFNAGRIVEPVQLQLWNELGQDGHALAGVLDQLRDRQPERFGMLNEEFGRWLPEFDQILFETPGSGMRSFMLRTREGKHAIRAADLSQGTLFALAVLTLAYIPDPPPIVCIEEPDRGIHPRLLREVRDALYRLAYPESFGEKRERVQVVATTHSPYFLDLFKERPEEIVIAHRVGAEARFERLSDQPNIEEILEGAHLGDVWYSGILGGVPPDR